MKHSEMDKHQRKKLEHSLETSRITEINIFSTEPYIELSNGTKIYINEVEQWLLQKETKNY